MGYSFVPVGGSVDKYEVKIYDSAGTTLIHTDTHTPSFPTPITGTFTYLNANTTYKVRVRVWIGVYYVDCNFSTAVTLSNSVVVINNLSGGTVTITAINSIAGFTLSGPLSNGQEYGTHTGFTAAIGVTLTGSPISGSLKLFRNGVQLSCSNIGAAGSYSFPSFTFALTDDIEVRWFGGAC